MILLKLNDVPVQFEMGIINYKCSRCMNRVHILDNHLLIEVHKDLGMKRYIFCAKCTNDANEEMIVLMKSTREYNFIIRK